MSRRRYRRRMRRALPSFYRPRTALSWPLCCRAVDTSMPMTRSAARRARWLAPSLLAPRAAADRQLRLCGAPGCSWRSRSDRAVQLDGAAGGDRRRRCSFALGTDAARASPAALLAVAGDRIGDRAGQLGHRRRPDRPASWACCRWESIPQARPVLRVDAGQPRQPCRTALAVAGRIGWCWRPIASALGT